MKVNNPAVIHMDTTPTLAQQIILLASSELQLDEYYWGESRPFLSLYVQNKPKGTGQKGTKRDIKSTKNTKNGQKGTKRDIELLNIFLSKITFVTLYSTFLASDNTFKRWIKQLLN